MVAQAITPSRGVTRVRLYKPAVTLPTDESMSVGEVAGVYNVVLCYYNYISFQSFSFITLVILMTVHFKLPYNG
jgi:hypothetical protein